MTLFGITLEPHWWWLVLALVLAIAEIAIPGVFLIWIGGAALVTGMLSLLLGLPPTAEFVVFAASAIGAVWTGRRWLKAHPIESEDPHLNDRGARLVGRIVTITQAIDGGEGKARVGDGEWLVSGPDLPVGARVRIVARDGSRLQVVPAEE